jgi:hypothetical protein
MALGKAFIEVHADTKPFAQELGKELGRILKAVENGPARKAGEKLGKELGEGASDGFEKSFSTTSGTGGSRASRSSLSNFFDFDTSGFAGRMAQGIVDALDDGLSGLPAELKVALGAALLVSLPVAGALGASLATAVITSFLTGLSAGLAVALGSQLTVVQNQWQLTLAHLRDLTVQWAQPVVGPLLTAFDVIRERASQIGPDIARFIELGSRAIVPLIDGIFSLVGNALPYLNSALSNIDTFANVIANGLGRMGTAFGRVIDNIANNDDAVTALNDILVLIEDLIYLGGGLVTLFLDVYGVARDIAEALDLFNLINFNTDLADGVRQTNSFSNSLRGLFTSTSAETKALDELNKQLEGYVSELNNSWSANINFEQSLDDLTQSLRENGRTTDINTQKGRDNQRAIQDAVLKLREQRDATILLTGDVDAANATFETNKQRLLDAATAGGITRQRFDELTAAILNVPPPITTGVTAQTLENLKLAGVFAAAAASQIAAMIANSRGLSSIRIPTPQRSYGVQQYSEGGIFNTPTLGVFGEAGEEVIIPTSKPARAAELISQSPMLSSMMSPSVNVYIGNQQIDAYIDQRVARSQAAIARNLSYGSRSL